MTDSTAPQLPPHPDLVPGRRDAYIEDAFDAITATDDFDSLRRAATVAYGAEETAAPAKMASESSPSGAPLVGSLPRATLTDKDGDVLHLHHADGHAEDGTYDGTLFFQAPHLVAVTFDQLPNLIAWLQARAALHRAAVERHKRRDGRA